MISVRFEPVAHSEVAEGICVQPLLGSGTTATLAARQKSREMPSVFNVAESCYRRKRGSLVGKCNLCWKHRFKHNNGNTKNS